MRTTTSSRPRRPSTSRARKEKKPKPAPKDAGRERHRRGRAAADRAADAGRATGHRPGRGAARPARGVAAGDAADLQGRGHHRGRTTGPVVTQFEVVPAPGVKAQRIVALADDLAIAMRAPSIRVAPIPGQGRGRRRGAQPDGAHGDAARAARVAASGTRPRAHAAGRAGPRPRGQAGRRRPGQDAAPADRRRHRLRQVGGDQHHHHQPGLPLHPARAAAADGRPEDGRAVDVQRAAPPAAQGGDQQPRRRDGAQVGGVRDGPALRAAARQRRAQPRRLQPQGARTGSRSGIRSRPRPTLTTIAAEAPDTPPGAAGAEAYNEGVLPDDRARSWTSWPT